MPKAGGPGHRLSRLVLYARPVPDPVLRDLVRRVQNGGRVARIFLAVVADRLPEPGLRHRTRGMALGAAHGPVDGDPGFEEEHVPELHLLRVMGLSGDGMEAGSGPKIAFALFIEVVRQGPRRAAVPRNTGQHRKLIRSLSVVHLSSISWRSPP